MESDEFDLSINLSLNSRSILSYFSLCSFIFCFTARGLLQWRICPKAASRLLQWQIFVPEGRPWISPVAILPEGCQRIAPLVNLPEGCQGISPAGVAARRHQQFARRPPEDFIRWRCVRRQFFSLPEGRLLYCSVEVLFLNLMVGGW